MTGLGGALDTLACLAGLVLVALVGRVVLAFCPPGDPGRSDPRARFSGLPATWAASFLVGAASLLALERLCLAQGWQPPALGLVAPFALLALLRAVTLPGAIVPREELPPARAIRAVVLARILLGVTLGALAWSSYAARSATAPDDPALAALARLVGLGRDEVDAAGALAAAALVALVVLVERGLERARRAPGGRAFAAAALALVLLPDPSRAHEAGVGPAAALAALGGAGALACAVAWLRRADRRGLALAALGGALAALALPRASALALGPVLAIPLAAALPSRRISLVATSGALALALGLAALSSAELGWAGTGLAPAGGLGVRGAVALGLVALAALGLVRAKRQAEPGAPSPEIRLVDPPARELAGAALGAALLFGAAPREPATSLAATAAAALAIALALLPPEPDAARRLGPPRPLSEPQE